jgi:hypothetical protein
VADALSLLEASSPRDVLQAAGEWLADQLAESGFVWARGKSSLQRRIGRRTEEIHLQGATETRTGKMIEVRMQVVVWDRDLRDWRRANPGIALRQNEWLVGHPLGYVAHRRNGYVYGDYSDGVVSFLDPDVRAATIVAVGAVIRDAVLPWFVDTAAPESMALAPEVTLGLAGSSVLEWLASRDRVDLIPPTAQRLLELRPGMRAGYDQGIRLAREGRRPPNTDGAQQLGWSVATLVTP